MTKSTLDTMYKTSILLILFITPLLYMGIISSFLNNLFDDETDRVMFLLYNTPFWFLLMFITGVELFRRAITRRFTFIAPVYMVMMGSILIGITGIVICPVAPALLSRNALVLITVNVTLGGVVGFVISKLFSNICNK